MSEKVERAAAAVSSERSLARVLIHLLREKRLTSFVVCEREMCVNGVNLFVAPAAKGVCEVKVHKRRVSA